MIDTDKYEGHTRGPWRYYDEEEHDCWVFEGEDIEAQARVAFFAFTPCEGIAYLDDPDLNLMIDAPLLLAEVKRLRLDLASGRITTIVNPNDDHNRTLYVTIEFPDGEVYRGYVEKEGDEE